MDKIIGNEGMVVDKNLPWLQDNAEQNVWASWDPTYRDVIILDDENHFVSAFNLTLNQLSDLSNREELKILLIDGEESSGDTGF